MKRDGRDNKINAVTTVRSLLLAAAALCYLLSFATFGWALSTGNTTPDLSLPEFRLPDTNQFAIPTFYRPVTREEDLTKNTPLLGKIQITLGHNRKLSLDAFSYGGKSSVPNLSTTSRMGLNGSTGVIDAWALPQIVPRTALTSDRALDEQAQTFKIGLQDGRSKFSMNLQNIGAKFPTTGIEGLSQQDAQAFAQAAGTRTFNLDGSYQLTKNAAFSSVRTSLYNDKPGDGNRGRTATDWVNSLSMNMGKNTNLRLALTDHSEAWDASTGKTDSSKRTMEMGGETKFGASGKYNLKFNLAQSTSINGTSEQSQKKQELHLLLPVATRLQLNADYTRTQDGAGNAQTLNLVTGVFKLYQGADLTASFKTQGGGGKTTQESFLKFNGDLGHGGSAAHLAAEQTATHTPDTGIVKNTKLDLTGGLGKGGGRINFHAVVQDRRANIESGPLESVATIHLDRAFGPRFNLVADYEQKLQGTVGTYNSNLKSTVGLTMQVTRLTKLTVGLVSQDTADSSGAHTLWNQDLILEQQLGVMKLRAEDQRRKDSGVQKAETSVGLDWPHGTLPEWANNLSRRHEFGDIYDYQVARESNWLDIPFAGTRMWAKQRTGGDYDGLQSFLVSHRMVLAKRIHLQLTYHERPEFEDGDKKGQPQSVHREYMELGTPVAKNLVGHTWLTRELKLDDPLSERRTYGLGVSGKLKDSAQAELYFTHDFGQWESKAIDRNVLALYYNRQLNQERNLSVKFGYAWGLSVGNGSNPEFRVTIALATPW